MLGSAVGEIVGAVFGGVVSGELGTGDASVFTLLQIFTKAA